MLGTDQSTDWFPISVVKTVILASILPFVILTVWHYKIKYDFSKKYKDWSLLKTLPKLPVLGHGLFLETDPVRLLKQLTKAAKDHFVLYKKDNANRDETVIWFSPLHPVRLFLNAAGCKKIMTDKSWNDKNAFPYFPLYPWLGTGVLTASGAKWKHRRRLLTPAFHTKILDDFCYVMNDQARKLVKKLYEMVNECPDKKIEIDMFRILTLSTLDIIAETAMGITVNALENPDQSYIEAIYKVTDYTQERQKYFWLWPEFSYKLLSKNAKDNFAKIDLMKKFTLDVIERKLQEYEKNHSKNTSVNIDKTDDLASNLAEGYQAGKKKTAFLDLLVEQYHENQIGIDGMREEVDTFMFEGHDTTSSALSFSTFLLGSNDNKKCLDQLNDELDQFLPSVSTNNFYDDLEKFTVEPSDLDNLSYLDSCIRESLRLFPPVPLISRSRPKKYNRENKNSKDNEESKTLNDGSIWTSFENDLAIIFMYYVGRDAEAWGPNVNDFDPDRFNLEKHPEAQNRSSFAWIPFSAGSRNCIGQRFALMEMKVILSYLFRFFRFEPCDSLQEIEDRLMSDIILRPKGEMNFMVSLR